MLKLSYLLKLSDQANEGKRNSLLRNSSIAAGGVGAGYGLSEYVHPTLTSEMLKKMQQDPNVRRPIDRLAEHAMKIKSTRPVENTKAFIEEFAKAHNIEPTQNIQSFLPEGNAAYSPRMPKSPALRKEFAGKYRDMLKGIINQSKQQRGELGLDMNAPILNHPGTIEQLREVKNTARKGSIITPFSSAPSEGILAHELGHDYLAQKLPDGMIHRISTSLSPGANEFNMALSGEKRKALNLRPASHTMAGLLALTGNDNLASLAMGAHHFPELLHEGGATAIGLKHLLKTRGMESALPAAAKMAPAFATYALKPLAAILGTRAALYGTRKLMGENKQNNN